MPSPQTIQQIAAVANLKSAGIFPLVVMVVDPATGALVIWDGGTSVTGGPVVQGLIANAGQSYLPGVSEPLSLTPDGSLRVSPTDAAWPSFTDDPWAGVSIFSAVAGAPPSAAGD